jgi:hypothetical protein
MSAVWKALLGLAVVLPLGAYVAGSLAASAADDPHPRHTIEIREPDPSRSPTPSPSSTGSAEPEVVVPSYHDLGDDHGGDDHGGDDHGGDDHGGRGHG